MIKDKTDGVEVKIAENPEEAFWETCRKRCVKEIDNSEKEIIINKHILILCEQKLKEK
jgi:hypothetical protein